MGDDGPEHRSKKPTEIIDDMVSELGGLQGNLQERALQVGEQRARLGSMRPYWARIEKARADDPGLKGIYDAGVGALFSEHREIASLRTRIEPALELVEQLQHSSDLTIGITGGTASMAIQGFDFPSEPAFFLTDKYTRTRDKLEDLDPSLCHTYEAIREVLHGTASDPERAAMYLLRQAFDHLFGLLALDTEVRSSLFWQQKPGASSQQVTREERITYAAHTHIRDKGRADSLASSSKHMVVVYRELNAAHKRGPLGSTRCRGALKEMQEIIEAWVQEIAMPSR